MKKLIAQIETLSANLEEQIAIREDKYDSRSKKWQDSEKGDDFRTISERMQETKDELDDLSGELRESIGFF